MQTLLSEIHKIILLFFYKQRTLDGELIVYFLTKAVRISFISIIGMMEVRGQTQMKMAPPCMHSDLHIHYRDSNEMGWTRAESIRKGRAILKILGG